MKHNFGVRALVLVLCFVLSLTCLFSCGNDEQIGEMNDKLNNLDTELGELEGGKVDKATFDALDALVKELDAAVEATVTTEKFEAALATLNAAIAAKADPATVAADLAAVKTALEGMINANATADAATKAALDAAAAKIAALEGTVATQAALDAAVAELEKAIADNEADVIEAITEIQAAIDANGTADAANLAALTETIMANYEAVALLINAANEAIAANGTADAATLAALNTLKGTVETNKTAVDTQLGTINETLAGLTTSTGANAADIETLNEQLAELQATVGALNVDKTVADAVKVVDDRVTALAGTLATEIAAVEELIDAEIEALKEELKADVKAAEDKFLEYAEKNDAEIENIKALLTKLEAQINTLNSAINGNFNVEEYNRVTDVLVDPADERSIVAFDAKVAAAMSGTYYGDVLATFKSTTDLLRIRALRATTIAELEKHHAELDNLINALPKIDEVLSGMIAEFEKGVKVLTTDVGLLDKINEVYDLATKAEVVDEALKARYDALVAAYENIKNAAEAGANVSAIIDAIATPIIYIDSLDAIKAAEDAVAALGEYFTEENAKYYGDATAESLVASYETLVEYRTRYDLLATAAENKVVFSKLVLSHDTVRPLWNQYAGLCDEKAAYEAWLDKYEIDTVVDAKSIENIYGIEVKMFIKTFDYAEYAYNVYVDLEIEKYAAMLAEYAAKNPVLYADAEIYDEIDAVRAKALELLQKNTGYEAKLDKNYYEMFGKAALVDFAAAYARIAELREAAEKISGEDGINARIADLLDADYTLVYGDGFIIEEIRDDLAAVVKTYGLDAESEIENYNAIVAATKADYDALETKYMNLISEIYQLATTVEDMIANTKWFLKDGGQIQTIVDSLAKFIFEHKLNSVELWIPTTDEAMDIDLLKLNADFNAAAAKYRLDASAAQKDAVAVNEAIAALKDLNPADIKNYAQFVAAYELFTKWCEAHLAKDIDAANGDVAQAIADIQGIVIFGTNVEYVFVIENEEVKNYTDLMAGYTAAVKAYEDAEDAWSAILANIETLRANYTIHSYKDDAINFVAVKAAYKAYLETYYAAEFGEDSNVEILAAIAGVIDADTDAFGELDIIPAFKTAMDDCKAKLDAAQGVADGIIEAIKALPEITTENVNFVLALIEGINARIADYVATYCNGDCMFIVEIEEGKTVDYRVVLYQNEMFAKYVVELAAAYKLADDTEEKENLDVQFDTTKEYIMNMASTKDHVDTAYSMQLDILRSFVAELTANAPELQ